MKITNTLLLLLSCFVFASFAFAGTNSVEIQLSASGIDKNQGVMYVDVHLKARQNSFVNLASQNYRIYYPSNKLVFSSQGSKSNLPLDKYRELHFTENLKNIDAGNIGQLDFDKDLGFVNFSIELKDLLNGGVYLKGSDSWLHVATLKFVVSDWNQDLNVVLSRDGISDHYATAFVELAEWIKPYTLESLKVDQYIDLNLSPKTKDDAQVDLTEVRLSPNPSGEFFNLHLSKTLDFDAKVLVKDLSGRLVKSVNAQKGSSNYRIDINDLLSSTYIIELVDDKNRSVFMERVIVTR